MNRLEKYNYDSVGVYFITICTENKKCILSKIVGDGVLDVPKIILSDYGKIAEEQILAINKTYAHIKIEHYVIMPNHIHLLVKIMDKNEAFDIELNGKSKALFNGTASSTSPTNREIPKLISTFKRFCNKKYNRNIWQRSYNDHIIRDEKDYVNHLGYINDNPFKWDKDEYYIINE